MPLILAFEILNTFLNGLNVARVYSLAHNNLPV